MRAILLIALFAGCASQETIVVGGLERSYLLHVPTSAAKAPAPLVLVFHGGGGSAPSMRRYSRFDEVADQQGFVVAYPNGIDSSWNDGRESPQIEAQAQAIDDVGFIRALIRAIQARTPIDPLRIYATGISNGAMLSLRLGCELADVLAGIAPVAGSLPEPLLERCQPAHPISVLLIHGTHDDFVPYGGGEVIKQRGRVIGVDQTRRRFQARNECKNTSGPKTIDDVKDDETSVVRAGWSGCLDQVEIEVDRIEGGGHTWPGSTTLIDFVLGTVSHEIDAPQRIWSFFAAHPRPGR